MRYGFLAVRWVNDDQFLVVWGRLLRRTWGSGTRALQFSTFSILLTYHQVVVLSQAAPTTIHCDSKRLSPSATLGPQRLPHWHAIYCTTEFYLI